MNIGIICYASIGGSGIVATELGKMLASRGHHVHVLSSETPFRLGDYQPGLSFHRVEAPTYPLFREPQYLLALANKIVQVSRAERLDIIHAHYAVPHATAAYLARQILGAANGGKVPRVITTLHGTDITLLGSDRSYSEIVAFSIERSDGVTAVSESLKADTYREFGQNARHPRHSELRQRRGPSSRRPQRSASQPGAGRREARHPRLELPSRQARGRRHRDLQAHPRRSAGTAGDGRGRPRHERSRGTLPQVRARQRRAVPRRSGAGGSAAFGLGPVPDALGPGELWSGGPGSDVMRGARDRLAGRRRSRARRGRRHRISVRS